MNPSADLSLSTPRSALAGRHGAVLALSYYPWDPRIRRETEALTESGMHVDLFCLRENDDEPEHENINGVAVTRLRLHHQRSAKLRYLFEYGCFFAWTFWRLAAASWRKRYSLVHVHNLPDALVFATAVPRLCGAQVILDLHDPMPELFRTIYGLDRRHPFVRVLTYLEKLSTRYADLVLTPNRSFHELFACRACAREKVNIVMNTPAEEIFRPPAPASAPAPAARPAAPTPFRLMHHGLIAPRHGLDILIRAVQLVRQDIPGVQLDIYGGENAYLRDMLQLRDELGLEHCVHYHGKKPLAEIAAIIGTIDLGIVPNRRSPFTELNFPTRLFEYLALKKPVVTLNTRGVRDYFAPDEIFYFDEDRPEELAAAIRRVHADPVAAQRVVERGHAVYRRHRWPAEKARFLSLVTQLVSANAAA